MDNVELILYNDNNGNQKSSENIWNESNQLKDYTWVSQCLWKIDITRGSCLEQAVRIWEF